MHRTLTLLLLAGCVGDAGPMPDAGGSAGGGAAGGSSAGGSTAGGASGGGPGGGTSGGTSGGVAGGAAGGTVIVGSMGGPVLFFTDLVTGPNTGNGDTSRGTGGAVVTVWG